MCDFREPPTKVNINNNVFDVEFRGNAGWHDNKLYKGFGSVYDYTIQKHTKFFFEDKELDLPPTLEQREITLPGIYMICGSGNYYSYFDGQKWHGYDVLLFNENIDDLCRWNTLKNVEFEILPSRE